MSSKAILKLTGLTLVLLTSNTFTARALDATCDTSTEECQDFLGGIPKIDAAQLSNVPVKCSEGAGIFGKKNCAELTGSVEKMVQQKLAKETTEYYKGKPINWVTGKQEVKGRVPICNLGNGEKDKNFRGESCGELCKFSVDTGLLGGGEVKAVPNTCRRERAYVRGIPVQLNTFHKEKVFSEFRARNVQLVDFDGVKPCAQLARDVVRGQAAIENVQKKLVEKIGSTEKAAQISCDSQNFENVCKVTGASAAQVQECLANASQMRLSACQMQMSNISLENLYKDLVKCEISSRVFKDLNQASPQDWFRDIANNVKPICQREVEDLGMFASDGSRTTKLNNCYEREFPQAMKKRLDQWKTQGTFDRETSSTGSSSTSSSGKKNSDAVFAFGGLLVALRRKKKLQRKSSGKLPLALLGALVLTGLASGCADSNAICEGENADPTVCLAAEDGACGLDDAYAQCPVNCEGTACSNGAGEGLNGVTPPPDSSAKAMQLASNVADPNVKKSPRMNENAATAATKGSDNVPFSGSGKAAGTSPGISFSAPTSPANGTASNAPSPVGGLPPSDNTETNPEELAAMAQEKDVTSEAIAMTSAGGNTAGSAGRNGPGFGGNDATGTGVSSATLGQSQADGAEGNGGTESIDNYLARVGGTSLFEIVNKRYYRWGTDLDAYNAKTSFKK